MARDISKAGLDLVRSHEGLRLLAYDDLQPNKRLKPGDKVKGTLTIGVGHTGGVQIGDTCTEAQAMAWLREDIDEAEADAEGALKAEANVNEYAAMVSLAFNIGGTNFRKSSVLRHHNAGNKQKAAQAFGLWNKSKGQVLPGLVRRRAEEAALYLKPVGKAAKSTATQTPDDVEPSMSGNDKAGAGAAAGGAAVAGGATLWEAGAGALKETSEWTWGLPETLAAIMLGGAVLVAAYVWWKRRKKRAK